jgi:uncharacterized protein (TIGR03437 family)
MRKHWQAAGSWLRLLALLMPPALCAQTLGPVRNLASHDNRLSPGALASINGPFGGRSGREPATVEVGGRTATVIFQEGVTAVIQIPVELAPGPTTLVATAGGTRLTPVTITLDAYAPGLYVEREYSLIGVFYRPWPFVVDCAHSVRPTVFPYDLFANEVVTVFATGLGPTSPSVPSGATAPSAPPATTAAKPTISVGGRPAEVLRSVLAPGMVGLYQIDFRMPDGLGHGFHPVVLNIAGSASNTVLLPAGNTFYNAAAARLGGFPLVEQEPTGAPESIMTARACPGISVLAYTDAIGDPRNPPTVLAGTKVKVTDSAGVERLAPLLLVSPFQVNYIIPAGTAKGRATIRIVPTDYPYDDGVAGTAIIDIQSVIPTLFTRDGFDLVRQVLRVRNGVATVVPADQPIDWGSDSDELYLVLFGSGFRFRSSLAGVRVDLGGASLPVVYAGPQGEYSGLDQLNVRLPKSLRGSNPGYWLVLTVDGNPLGQDVSHDLKIP